MSAPEVVNAECLHSPGDVEAACDRMAGAIDTWLDGRDGLALCLLQGGIVPAGLLLPRIAAPLQLDSIHVTRYRNTTRGHELDWHALPKTQVRGRRILLIDDILDEGESLAGVRQWCEQHGAASVWTAVLVDKCHTRKNPRVRADCAGLQVPDRYVFGYGMDYRGWHRNAAGIFALGDS